MKKKIDLKNLTVADDDFSYLSQWQSVIDSPQLYRAEIGDIYDKILFFKHVDNFIIFYDNTENTFSFDCPSEPKYAFDCLNERRCQFELMQLLEFHYQKHNDGKYDSVYDYITKEFDMMDYTKNYFDYFCKEFDTQDKFVNEFFEFQKALINRGSEIFNNVVKKLTADGVTDDDYYHALGLAPHEFDLDKYYADDDLHIIDYLLGNQFISIADLNRNIFPRVLRKKYQGKIRIGKNEFDENLGYDGRFTPLQYYIKKVYPDCPNKVITVISNLNRLKTISLGTLYICDLISIFIISVYEKKIGSVPISLEVLDYIEQQMIPGLQVNDQSNALILAKFLRTLYKKSNSLKLIFE